MMESMSTHVVLYVVELKKNIGFFSAFCLRVDMGDGDKSKKMISTSEMENFSLDSSRISRDLLNRFMEGRFDAKEEEEDEEEEEEGIELNLGLSLGGRFGVDKSSNKLIRSSSIAACLPTVRDDDAVAASPPPVSYPSLVRTSSLPVETEEEWRKRKELQTLRRMEAKRRRSEKQRNLKADREGGGGGSRGGGEEEKKEIEMNLRGRLEKDKLLAAAKRFSSSVAPPLGMAMMAANAGQSILGGGIDVAMAKGKGSYVGGSGMQGFGQPLSQGSLESPGGSSSSELESRALQGSSSCGEPSPVSIKSLQEGSSQDVGSSGAKIRDSLGRRTSGVEMENLSKQADIAKNRGKESGMNALEDMPCVFTKGDGPNGRRVDGILYRYGKGEEVRIMCVCHGNFLSPAEFVKHAGGTDVAHPLKHIVVNPNASPFL
ncbi:hypothetical protein ACH5RR_035961 [Cinchona calisaya]|uniref:Ninja-family protein n=1 Tax=Cinchona calisaya TaxID=153742 RepID=A0ABD2Y6K2_9GENT